MKHATLAFVVAAALAMAAGQVAAAGRQDAQAKPTQAEVDQHAMQHGPATPRIGYLTHRDPPAPKRDSTPVDPKLLRPLTQREVGMLYNACTAYAECRTAYARAYEHNQALLNAKRATGTGD